MFKSVRKSSPSTLKIEDEKLIICLQQCNTVYVVFQGDYNLQYRRYGRKRRRLLRFSPVDGLFQHNHKKEKKRSENQHEEL